MIATQGARAGAGRGGTDARRSERALHRGRAAVPRPPQWWCSWCRCSRCYRSTGRARRTDPAGQRAAERRGTERSAERLHTGAPILDYGRHPRRTAWHATRTPLDHGLAPGAARGARRGRVARDRRRGVFLFAARTAAIRTTGWSAKLPVDIARPARGDKGALIGRSVTINRPRQEVYARWRDFTRFPEFMENVRSVENDHRQTSHWTIEAPAGKRSSCSPKLPMTCRASGSRGAASKGATSHGRRSIIPRCAAGPRHDRHAGDDLRSAGGTRRQADRQAVPARASDPGTARSSGGSSNCWKPAKSLSTRVRRRARPKSHRSAN